MPDHTPEPLAPPSERGAGAPASAQAMAPQEAPAAAAAASPSGAPARQLTFLAPECGLCLRWGDRRHSWRHRSEGGFDRTRYEVAPIPDDATARAYCERNHYSGRVAPLWWGT
jgi:hypothetical protein